MWNTNHHLRRPQASFHSPKGEEALRPPRSDLRSPGRISRLGEYRISDGNSARKTGSEKEMTRGNQSFQKLIQFLYFSGLFIYLFVIHRDEYGVMAGVSRPDPCHNQVLHIKLYKGLMGLTSSSGHETC